ncbi:expressed unknown protein [Seminavis robusta]|uniref:Uncharacterized protein n=1 Tax=Seminavis robusta TaxID=568900 RepID=A0A9N8HDM8_9STRA|nr:expressed unknown protein [Seminavis robusta]|eukprot:Sro368_g128070.1 n/a (554) ;mRNA; r:67560-69331
MSSDEKSDKVDEGHHEPPVGDVPPPPHHVKDENLPPSEHAPEHAPVEEHIHHPHEQHPPQGSPTQQNPEDPSGQEPLPPPDGQPPQHHPGHEQPPHPPPHPPYEQGPDGGPPPGHPHEHPPGHGPPPPPGYPPQGPPGARPPDGYYAPYPPPPPGYEGAPPPHHMYPPPPGHPSAPGHMPPPYPPMYPPHYHPHYPPYPMYPPPPYGYPEHHHAPPGDRRYDQNPQGSPGGYDDDPKDGNIIPGAVTARLKTYIKPRIPSTQEVLDRRSRKNAQSRARAAKLRDRISEIESKPEAERTEEERTIYGQYEARRQRKNDRSRERALEKKEEIDRILAKPEKKRTKIEKQFLETALSAKKRKNEGDRLRRQRLKELGLSSKGTGVKPGISARGPLPPQYQAQRGGYPQDIPMSPLPTMPHHHHSPGGFGSPGMHMSFPSPSQGGQRRPPSANEGPPDPEGIETPRREGQQPLPYIPPEGEDGGGDASRVEQRRNPDGSMSISIGGNRGDGDPAAYQQGGEGESSVNISDVSHLLLNENDYGGDSGVAEQSAEKAEE